MLRFSDIIQPSTKRNALDERTGEILCLGTMSRGQRAFAEIAKTIVEYGRVVDEDGIRELKRLLDVA
jgi:hypothetical protein